MTSERELLPPVPPSQEELTAADGAWFWELWRFRELLYFLAWRDVKVRYKQAFFGAAWAVIQPLFTMLIFTFFFGRMAKVPTGDIPYPVFCFSALVAWTYFAGTLGLAGNSLIGNANLLTKIYFPRVLLPAASALSGLLDFGVGSAFLFAMMAYYRVKPGWTLILWPLIVLEMAIVTLGISMLFAALNVRYRDVKHVIPFMVQLGLFITPVIYPPEFLPPRWHLLLALNPLSGVMECFRACFFPSYALDVRLVMTSSGVALLLLVVGVLYFRNAERTFADIV
jgi:homopolymeric O-antigen transport system permease protein